MEAPQTPVVHETVKRKSRNMSEKKRRDQFNTLIGDLCTMVSKNKKMDKTTVLKTAIAVIKNHKEQSDKLRSSEIKEDWKPSFMTNNEFIHVMLEAVGGFVMVMLKKGVIVYTSESVTPLLGYLPGSLSKKCLYDILHPSDRTRVYNSITNSKFTPTDEISKDFKKSENHIHVECHMRCDNLRESLSAMYEPVIIEGSLRKWSNSMMPCMSDDDCDICLCCTVTLIHAEMLRILPSLDSNKKEFTSRHSLEWKFLFLDHRGPPLIGYLPFEVLGTSGYDYIHPDDLEKLASCHEKLMEAGTGTSHYYRFLTKGQQWIWLQTRSYITYHQWNSKPEFVVCTNTVVSYSDVKSKDSTYWTSLKQESGLNRVSPQMNKQTSADQVTTSTWLEKSPDSPHAKHDEKIKIETVSVSCAESSTSPTEIKTHKKEVPPISITTLQTLKSEIAKNLVAGPKNTNSIKKSLELLTNTAKSLVSKQKREQEINEKELSSEEEHQHSLSENLQTSQEQLDVQSPAVPIVQDDQDQLEPVAISEHETAGHVYLTSLPLVTTHTAAQITDNSHVIVQPQLTLNPIQQHLQIQLLEKHQQLQANILRQQQELQKISNQLLLVSGMAAVPNSPAIVGGVAGLEANNVATQPMELVQQKIEGMHYVLNANPQFITENSHQFTTQSVIQNTPSVVSGASSAQILGLDVNHTLPSNSSNTVQYIHAGSNNPVTPPPVVSSQTPAIVTPVNGNPHTPGNASGQYPQNNSTSIDSNHSSNPATPIQKPHNNSHSNSNPVTPQTPTHLQHPQTSPVGSRQQQCGVIPYTIVQTSPAGVYASTPLTQPFTASYSNGRHSPCSPHVASHASNITNEMVKQHPHHNHSSMQASRHELSPAVVIRPQQQSFTIISSLQSNSISSANNNYPNSSNISLINVNAPSRITTHSPAGLSTLIVTSSSTSPTQTTQILPAGSPSHQHGGGQHAVSHVSTRGSPLPQVVIRGSPAPTPPVLHGSPAPTVIGIRGSTAPQFVGLRCASSPQMGLQQRPATYTTLQPMSQNSQSPIDLMLNVNDLLINQGEGGMFDLLQFSGENQEDSDFKIFE